jgi:hypothetical protein
MSSDLVLRMRTCAAAIVAVDPHSSWVALVSDDAARLLVEASNALDTIEEPLGEPMAPLDVKRTTPGGAVWTAAGELPDAVPRPCPSCGNVGARTVHIAGRRLMLTCAMCSHQWEYVP